MEQLELLAKRFRDAIERIPPQQLPITLQSFPAGACGDATLLLGHYLKAQGLGPFDYVLGERQDHSHAWLQQGEVIIDITADQFPEVDEAVIVTATPTWHHEFTSEVLHEADFTISDTHTVAMLGAAYHRVMQHLEVPA
ncbi:hypothetical protein ELH27_37080 [Rhizobium leguminosarum]|uniref:Uncharacterized protein n=1 Tax=Rhizobium beringeri TaxID=3019934 RepID=A0ABY1XIJ7_9HYPH|nr:MULTISPECIES: hypothetical protein [Rhizobium]TBC53783.1 hypothetical protein ELH27_37080 [Rhizobium leguminosarum]TBE57569.1 hypothetical protein ELH03_36915 [Rhizobium beringeri]